MYNQTQGLRNSDDYIIMYILMCVQHTFIGIKSFTTDVRHTEYDLNQRVYEHISKGYTEYIAVYIPLQHWFYQS